MLFLCAVFAVTGAEAGGAFGELTSYRPLSFEGQRKTIFFDDFESEKRVWQGGWRNYPIRRGDGLTGSGAMVHIRQPGDKHRFVLKEVELEKGRTYRLSAMVRVEGALNSKGDTPAALSRMIGVEFKKDEKWLSDRLAGPRLTGGDCDWTEISLEFSVPEAANRSRLLLTFPRNWSCRLAAWDNVTLEEVGEAPPVIYPITPKSLRLDREGRIRFAVYHGGTRKDEDLRLFAAYNDEKTFSAPVKDGTAEIAMPDLPPGRYGLRLKLADTAAKRIVAESEFPFVMPAGPAPDDAVGIDESGRLSVNNKRFFPIVLIMERPARLDTPEKIDTALGRIRGVGFNTVILHRELAMKLPDKTDDHGSTAALRQSLDFFAKHDLKVIPSLVQITGSKPDRILKSFDGLTDKNEMITPLVNGIKDHPALLAYYTTDEEPLDKLDPAIRLRFKLSELDPYRPVITCTNLAPNYPYFSLTGDVLMIDRYPISSAKTQSMYNVRECFEIWQRNCRLGQWFIGQAFNWGIYKKGQKYEEFRYPTEQEMRSMCLLALNFRSRGIVLYAYESIFTWQERRDPGSSQWFWPQVTSVVRLLNELEPFFMADAAPAPVKLASTGASKVEAKLHTADDGKQLVVVTADGPGEGVAVLDVGIDGLKSRFGFTRPLGGGKYEFKAENIAADLLEP